eukprot:4531696-Pyramimonas_sp.AAC.1
MNRTRNLMIRRDRAIHMCKQHLYTHIYMYTRILFGIADDDAEDDDIYNDADDDGCGDDVVDNDGDDDAADDEAAAAADDLGSDAAAA